LDDFIKTATKLNFVAVFCFVIVVVTKIKVTLVFISAVSIIKFSLQGNSTDFSDTKSFF
jgi:hypothetical protein